ncbi:MAG: helix-hairpin-helix domain-containing protein [Gemmatimonadaceae bacterium]|nr:helix-hairpin-helix domain-containing protein [Gemmatimonadaceae bacterium]
MPTPDERKALLFLATIAVLGVGVRAVARERPADPGDRIGLASQLAAVDSAIASGGARRSPARAAPPDPGRALSPGARSRGRRPAIDPTAGVLPGGGRQSASEAVATPRAPEALVRVDVDVADAATLEQLPGIGPALAGRIVEDRARRGPFGSVEALARVAGIGPALVARLRPHVTFSGSPRPPDTEVPVVRRARRHP